MGRTITSCTSGQMRMEIAGHEWWSNDGKAIWYQLHYPTGMGKNNFIASENVATGERFQYSYNRDATSIHPTSRPMAPSSAGGDKSNPWIVLCHVVPIPDRNTRGTNLAHPGYLTAERLVNMSKHNYLLEPNPMFTPNQKLIIFRSNMLGPTFVFGVEVAKAAAP